MTLRVVVAEDQELVRSGIVGILTAAPDLDVVAEAGDGEAAVAVALEERPDVVLVDVRMPRMDGIEATRLITAACDARVLVLTTFDLDEYVYDALRAGASGFLLKDVPPLQLQHAIRVVAAGDMLLAPGATRRLVDVHVRGERSSLEVPEQLASLTPRELQVLALVGDGLSNADIGHRLRIGAGTVKTHVSRLLMKLHARDRVQLVILAMREGVASPSAAGSPQSNPPVRPEEHRSRWS